MTAKEFRIGNLIQWLSTGTIETVMDIVTYKGRVDRINNVSIHDCMPIPLTEEWLLKFGFERIYDCKTCYKLEFDDIRTLEFLNTELFCYLNDYKVSHLKFVHQLQNLYFALTGNELTIK
jgi:uncharacterized protein YmfQ (DUF2313 family)